MVGFGPWAVGLGRVYQRRRGGGVSGGRGVGGAGSAMTAGAGAGAGQRAPHTRTTVPWRGRPQEREQLRSCVSCGESAQGTEGEGPRPLPHASWRSWTASPSRSPSLRGCDPGLGHSSDSVLPREGPGLLRAIASESRGGPCLRKASGRPPPPRGIKSICEPCPRQ